VNVIAVFSVGAERERERAIMGIRINVVSIDRVIDEKIIK